MTDLSILVYGYGNPGRTDDALGILFSQELEKKNYPGLLFDNNYQLNAEDALLISEYDAVIFADASHKPDSFCFSRLQPSLEIGFTTHAMHPGSVLALCHQLYDKHPQTFLMEIRGYEWDMAEKISDKARENLNGALTFIDPLLKNPESLKSI